MEEMHKNATHTLTQATAFRTLLTFKILRITIPLFPLKLGTRSHAKTLFLPVTRMATKTSSILLQVVPCLLRMVTCL